MSRFTAFVASVLLVGAGVALLPDIPAAAAPTQTVTIAADYQQKYYTDATPRFTYSVAGLQRGEQLRRKPTCGVAGAHANAGKYVITCRGAIAPAGYRIAYRAQRYLVARSPILVGPRDQYIVYGSPDPAFSWAVFGLKRGERLTARPTCDVTVEHSHAGVYPIVCTGARASRNYTLNLARGRLHVVKAVSIMKAETFLPSGVVRATLGAAKPDLQRLAGQKITFTTGSTTLCSATTDAQGVASCSPGANAGAIVGAGSYTARYAGTRDIEPTTASAKSS